jgi:hypothetical protein
MKDIREMRRMLGTLKCTIMDMIFFPHDEGCQGKMGMLGRMKVDACRNPNLAKCGGEAQHLEKFGIWSPPGLPNVQSSTAGPKTPRIGVFLVSLERS